MKLFADGVFRLVKFDTQQLAGIDAIE